MLRAIRSGHLLFVSGIGDYQPLRRAYFGSTGFGISGQLLQIDAIAYVD